MERVDRIEDLAQRARHLDRTLDVAVRRQDHADQHGQHEHDDEGHQKF